MSDDSTARRRRFFQRWPPTCAASWVSASDGGALMHNHASTAPCTSINSFSASSTNLAAAPRGLGMIGQPLDHHRRQWWMPPTNGGAQLSRGAVPGCPPRCRDQQALPEPYPASSSPCHMPVAGLGQVFIDNYDESVSRGATTDQRFFSISCDRSRWPKQPSGAHVHAVMSALPRQAHVDA